MWWGQGALPDLKCYGKIGGSLQSEISIIICRLFPSGTVILAQHLLPSHPLYPVGMQTPTLFFCPCSPLFSRREKFGDVVFLK